jgi:hypothetical protein
LFSYAKAHLSLDYMPFSTALYLLYHDTVFMFVLLL